MTRYTAYFLSVLILAAAVPSSAAERQNINDTAAAQRLAQEAREKFTAQHPETILEKGALHFSNWQAFYTYVASLNGIEPSPENLLKLSAWSTNYWQYDELMGQWYFVMKVDFYDKAAGIESIRDKQSNGVYLVVLVEERGVTIVGAFGGNYYAFKETKNGMPVIEPFWREKPNCCVKPLLEWDREVYKTINVQ